MPLIIHSWQSGGEKVIKIERFDEMSVHSPSSILRNSKVAALIKGELYREVDSADIKSTLAAKEREYNPSTYNRIETKEREVKDIDIYDNTLLQVNFKKRKRAARKAQKKLEKNAKKKSNKNLVRFSTGGKVFGLYLKH